MHPRGWRPYLPPTRLDLVANLNRRRGEIIAAAIRDAADHAIDQAAAKAGATDSDLAHLQIQHGPPPQILWLTCGSMTEALQKAHDKRPVSLS